MTHFLVAPAAKGPLLVSERADHPRAVHEQDPRPPDPDSICHWRGAYRSRSVASCVGPTPQINLLGLDGDRNNVGLMSPNPEALSACRKQRRLVDDRHDGARDQVPVLGQLDRDHRLDIENIHHLRLCCPRRS